MDDKLTHSIDSATQALFARQRPDGHWVFELEADATIPAVDGIVDGAFAGRTAKQTQKGFAAVQAGFSGSICTGVA